ncbi:MAG: 3,4-dihydroxy-2-butanone-4-phosphate synthase [Gammaproteobacteria bacterium]|nr:MAG: 3,4-dihydroxy-2-butanone-4-phosphate synthase [Gammaproteobacteria bacterium]
MPKLRGEMNHLAQVFPVQKNQVEQTSPISHIIEDIRLGKMVILIAKKGQENKGTLLLAADFISPDHINFMIQYARGLICLSLNEAHCQQLELPLMASTNTSMTAENFTVSIEAAQGVTTGISTADRARTIQAAVATDAKPQDIVKPGHIFPLMANSGGVLVCANHAEAGCDIAELAGLGPSAVMCDILDNDGEVAQMSDLLSFASDHDIKVGTIADLVHHRIQNEILIERLTERDIQIPYGTFRLFSFKNTATQQIYLTLVHGQFSSKQTALVKVCESLSLPELLETTAQTDNWRMTAIMELIQKADCGVIILLEPNDNDQQCLHQRTNGKLPQFAINSSDIGLQIIKNLGIRHAKFINDYSIKRSEE